MQPDDRDGLRAYRFETIPGERVDALVSTRLGGASAGPYAALNLGLHVGDDDATVVANRRAFFSAFGLPFERSVWCKQVHEDAVAVIDVCPRGSGPRGRHAGHRRYRRARHGRPRPAPVRDDGRLRAGGPV